jgi:hypothetical protein
VVAATDTGLNLALKLYYDDAELNGIPEGDVYIGHCVSGAWVWTTGTYTRDTVNNWVQVDGLDSLSPFVLTDYIPTSVMLSRFEGWSEDATIHVQWETSQETENLGFNLYRSATRISPKRQLNQELIPSLVPPGSPFGAVYDWIDAKVRPSRTYWYWLEDVDLYGNKTMHGPVRVRTP